MFLIKKNWIGDFEPLLRETSTLMGSVFPARGLNRDNWSWVELRHDFNDIDNPPDVEETETETIIRVVAPGVSKDAFKVTLEGRVLTISYEAGDNKFCQSSTRRWGVAKGTTKKDLTASHENGILVVRIAKQEKPVKAPVETIEVK